MSKTQVVTAVPFGPVRALARPLLFGGRLHVVAIAKTRLTLVPEGAARAFEPPTLELTDVVDRRTGVCSAPSDAAPYKVSADVTFTGFVHSFSKRPIARTTARLAIVQPERRGGPIDGGLTLIDKTLEIVGPRHATSSWPNAQPTTFTKLAVSYDHAFGGPNYELNPVGTGKDADPRGRIHLPCISYPADAVQVFEPAGFGPIPATWPARTALLPPDGAAVLARDIPDLHTGFDFNFFQAAPPDQRIAYLRGDEWIYLERLNPVLEHFASRLPNLEPRATVRLADGTEESFELNIDGLHIDGEAATCDVTARGTFALAPELELSRISIEVGFDVEGVRSAPSRAKDRPQNAAMVTVPLEPAAPRRAGTMVIEMSAPKPGTMILEPEPPRREQPRRAGTMLIEQGKPAPVKPQQRRLPTVIMEDEESVDDRPTIVARKPVAGAGAPRATMLIEPSSLEQTGTVDTPPPSTRAPFRLAPPRADSSKLGADIPGAPWARDAAPFRIPKPVLDPTMSTLPLDSDTFDETTTADDDDAPPVGVRSTAQPVLPQPALRGRAIVDEPSVDEDALAERRRAEKRLEHIEQARIEREREELERQERDRLAREEAEARAAELKESGKQGANVWRRTMAEQPIAPEPAPSPKAKPGVPRVGAAPAALKKSIYDRFRKG
ncbi:MAG: DUF2169 domain-containing protein [Polyangiaceae bacterium]